MSEDKEEFNFELSGLIYLCSSGSLASILLEKPFFPKRFLLLPLLQLCPDDM